MDDAFEACRRHRLLGITSTWPNLRLSREMSSLPRAPSSDGIIPWEIRRTCGLQLRPQHGANAEQKPAEHLFVDNGHRLNPARSSGSNMDQGYHAVLFNVQVQITCVMYQRRGKAVPYFPAKPNPGSARLGATCRRLGQGRNRGQGSDCRNSTGAPGRKPPPRDGGCLRRSHHSHTFPTTCWCNHTICMWPHSAFTFWSVDG